MAEGWGEDFDDEGNVIGEVPDDSPEAFHEKHKYKIVAVWLGFVLINLPEMTSPGMAVGVAITALVISMVLVFVGVKISSALR